MGLISKKQNMKAENIGDHAGCNYPECFTGNKNINECVCFPPIDAQQSQLSEGTAKGDEAKPKCRYVKRDGESCTLNNQCKYPDCPPPQLSSQEAKAIAEAIERESFKQYPDTRINFRKERNTWVAGAKWAAEYLSQFSSPTENEK